MTEVAPPAAALDRPALADREVLASTAAVTAGNVASRLTGFLRVLAVGAVLGTTFAGNTYQSANLVSNVLFELLAAGLLSSVLVPPFVRLLDDGRRDDAERLAGAVLGLALVGLGVVTAAGLIARPWIMWALTVAVDDAGVRRQEVALGSFLLALFLPQVLFYAVGSVATGLLHGCRRFGAAAFAPVANNALVIVTMGLFWALHRSRPGLDLSTTEKLVLGLGTTAGVVAMTLVPVVALRRAGVRLRPRWDPRLPGLRRLARDGAWAMGMVALAQVLLVTTLVLANRVEGGVVAYHIAFQVFLLPFALLAHPVVTTLYPRLASAAAGEQRAPAVEADAEGGHGEGRGRTAGPAPLAATLSGGIGTLAFLTLPASALLLVLAEPALRLIRVGGIDASGARLIASLVGAYAIGLLAYAVFQFLVRASYATGDARTPTVVALTVAAAGSAAMAGGFALAERAGAEPLAAVGYGHSLAFVAGALVLGAVLRRRVPAPWPVLASLARSLAAAAAAAGVAAGVVAVLPSGGRMAAAATVLLGGGAGLVAYLAVQRALAAPELRQLAWRRP